MQVPKHVLLTLLAKGLDDGTIRPSEIRKMLPPEVSCKVDPDLRRRAIELTEQHGLKADGLRLSPQKSAKGHMSLYLLTKENTVAGPRLAVSFTGMDDIDQAAEQVIKSYLTRLVDGEE